MERKIFQIKNGLIEVYSLIPNKYKIKEFRKQELDKMPIEERFIIEDKNVSWFSPKDDIVFSCGAFSLRKNVGKNKEKNIDIENVLTKKYLNGELNSDSISTVVRDDNNEQLIYINPNRNTTSVKIQLTTNLHQLELFERGMYNELLLQGESLDELNNIYKIGDYPIDEISINELKKAFDNNLIEEDFHEKIDSIEKMSKVLKKIKKIK